MTDGWLKDQVAIVTGAGAGIGRAVTERFVQEGARVVAQDRDARRLNELKAALGDQCAVAPGDASDPEVIRRGVDMALNEFGRLDAAVGHVGIFDWHKRVARMTAEELRSAAQEIFSTNITSHLLLANTAYEPLKAGGGNLILTCSIASFRGGGGGVLYTASKFAVRGLVYQLAHEWAPDIRVNGVAPGGTKTSLSGLSALGTQDRGLDDDDAVIAAIAAATPLGFAAEPEDHASAYVLLASKRAARAMTGTVIVSDGGLISSV